MKPIKKIAGDLLVFFYSLQRNNKLNLTHIISFGGHPGANMTLNKSSDLEKGMLNIAEDSIHDIYGALKYLEELSFIDFKETGTNTGALLHGLRLTAYGIDIIEGIERGKEERNQFNVTFNIKLADNINIESLIKMELESLLKASLI